MDSRGSGGLSLWPVLLEALEPLIGLIMAAGSMLFELDCGKLRLPYDAS